MYLIRTSCHVHTYPLCMNDWPSSFCKPRVIVADEMREALDAEKPVIELQDLKKRLKDQLEYYFSQ